MSTSKFWILLLILLVSVEITYANPVPTPEDSKIGWYQFDSLPQGEIVFDDISYGKTPVYIPVDVDSHLTHNVIIKIVGFEDYSRELNENPKSGETISVTLDTKIITSGRNLFSCDNI